MPNPLLTALGASVGSIALMGAATIAVASTSLAVIQSVSARHKMKSAVACTSCHGSGTVRCEICWGKGIIRARAPRSMRQLLQEARGNKGPAPGSVDCICPACGTTMEQQCLNCLGKGKVCLPS